LLGRYWDVYFHFAILLGMVSMEAIGYFVIWLLGSSFGVALFCGIFNAIKEISSIDPDEHSQPPNE